MGTDIHPRAERRINRVWTRVEAAICDNRHYDCFAILANVCNVTGFAGVITGAGWRPISEPRGLPHDLAEGYDEWELGDHSFSWLSLRELMEYDYTQESRKEGVMSLQQFAKLEGDRHYDKYASPQSYAGSISGGYVTVILPEAAREIISGWSEEIQRAVRFGNSATAVLGDAAKEIYVRDTWPRRYLDVMGPFLLSLIPLIKYGLDDVRIVFGFDS